MVQDVTLGAHEAHVGAAHPASLSGRQLHARLADKRAADDAAGAGELHGRHHLCLLYTSLVLAALDISGRGQLHWDVEAPFGMVGDFDTQLAREFFIALAANAGITLHIRQLAGDNVHHIFEAAFKAAGRALRQAVAVDPALGGAVPSTKGVL